MRMDELCAENIWKTTFPPHISPKCPWESLCILLGSSLSQTQLINQFWEAGSGVSEGLGCAPAMELRIWGHAFICLRETWNLGGKNVEVEGCSSLWLQLASLGASLAPREKGKQLLPPRRRKNTRKGKILVIPPFPLGRSHFQIFSFLRCQIALTPLPFRQQSLDYPFFAFFLPKSDHYPPFSSKCSHLQL